MKKAPSVLLIITVIFICIMTGIMFGRHSAKNFYAVPETESVQTQQTLTLTQNASDSGKVNINTANVTELKTLPGIGDVLAQRIVDYRTQYGPFSSIEDLTFVEGIGDKRIDDLRALITTGG